jgi:hypothetical protein
MSAAMAPKQNQIETRLAVSPSNTAKAMSMITHAKI